MLLALLGLLLLLLPLRVSSLRACRIAAALSGLQLRRCRAVTSSFVLLRASLR